MSDEGKDGGEGSPQNTELQKQAEETTVTDDVRIEVDILALEAARKIAEKIADEIVGLKPDMVVLGGQDVPGAIRAYTAFQGRYERLLQELDALPPKTHTEIATEAVEGAIALIEPIAKLMSYFKAETNYFGRKVELGESALLPLVAGQLLSKSIVVVLPEVVAPSGSASTDDVPSVFEMIEALIARRRQLGERPGEPLPVVSALLAKIDALLDGALKPDTQTGVTSIGQLLLGSDVSRLTAQSNTPLFLSLKSIAAGGHVRTRKHLFTTIFTGDKLSFSGGAAVGYVIVNLKTARAVGGNVLSGRETMRGE